MEWSTLLEFRIRQSKGTSGLSMDVLGVCVLCGFLLGFLIFS